MDPKEFMMGVVGDETLPMDLRQMAARDVIAYIHKKMPQAVLDLTNDQRVRKSFVKAVLESDSKQTETDGSGGQEPES